jgi:hypothetical protein
MAGMMGSPRFFSSQHEGFERMLCLNRLLICLIVSVANGGYYGLFKERTVPVVPDIRWRALQYGSGSDRIQFSRYLSQCL